MERLFAMVFLTLICALEVVFLLNVGGGAVALALVFCVLALVLISLLVIQRGRFWQISMLALFAQAGSLCYLYLRIGRWMLLDILLLLVAFEFVFYILYYPRQGRRVHRFAVRSREALPTAPVPEGIRVQRQNEVAHGVHAYPSQLIFEYETEDEKPVEAPAVERKNSINKSEKPAGRYVGSSEGRTYHEPACFWAKRIGKEKRVWFMRQAEAEKKGYSRHNCVKE